MVSPSLTRHAEQTGVLMASTVVPSTFASSLGPRSVADQAVVTGTVAALTYATTVAAQDALAALAAARPEGGRERSPEEIRRRLIAVELVAAPIGVILGRALPVRDDEPLRRSLLRQVAWRVGVTGLASLLLTATDAGIKRLDDRLCREGRLCKRGRLRRLPIALPVGVVVAGALDWRRRASERDPSDPTRGRQRQGVMASLAAGIGVTAGLSALAVGEERLASVAGSVLAPRLPVSRRAARLAGHLAVLSAVGGTASLVWVEAMRRVESGASAVDAPLDGAAGHPWVLDTCSGSRDSLISWELLGREGRRHVVTVVQPRPRGDRPEGVPDLSIPTVMGGVAAADPIAVYVSLDSATTIRERVDLAIKEMDRTQAWDRKLLVLVSPTGSGYVNYCAVAAAQYLTRGDVATVTLQYSKRPSPLSLGKIAVSREQNRLLWSRIAERLRAMPPEQRPRVVIFGESLGAHTSQDVFLHWGTQGLLALGIDRALWVGTPYSSGWAQQVTYGARPDKDPEVVTVVNDFAQIEALPQARRDHLRYLLVSHDNDGVTKFGTDLLFRPPGWLRGPRQPVEAVPPHSPRGVPPQMQWRPLSTFFQLLVDMKNAQTCGPYEASRHDYRPELARFINEVYGLGATEGELRLVEEALARREAARERLFA